MNFDELIPPDLFDESHDFNPEFDALHETKTCIDCNETKLVTEFHIHKRGDDGIITYHPRCKMCRNARLHSKRRRVTPIPTTKTCIECSQTKAVSEFHIHRRGADGTVISYQPRCMICRNARRASKRKVQRAEKMITTSKKCLECSQIKALSEFHITRRYGDKLFYHSRCKICRNAIRTAQRKASRPKKIVKRPPASKICIICNITKPVSEFNIQKRVGDTVTKYTARCKECKHIKTAKMCRRCGLVRTIDYFDKYRLTPGGEFIYHSKCISCFLDENQININE